MKRTPTISSCCEAKAKMDMTQDDGSYFCTKCGKGCLTKDHAKHLRTTRSTLSNVRKPTGELVLFREIYLECKGRSEVSGLPLLPPSHPMFHWQFSHILPNGHYPRLRLVRENTVACLIAEHEDWERVKDRDRLLKKEGRWKPFVEREERARLKYNTEAQ